jgi:hypothetical protein
MQQVRGCLGWSSRALGEKPLACRLWTKALAEELLGQSHNPASKAVGPVSPNDLLADWSRLEQPEPADSVKG